MLTAAKEQNVIWSPQPKQRIFMSRPEYEALFGGAAGGGKSDALIAEAMRQVDKPNYRAIIFRKTFPQCRELIDKSLKIYKRVYPRAKYNATSHTWTFPSGAQIMFGSMPNSTSFRQYQGHEYAFVGFDELTHFTQEEYEWMITRNRCADKDIRVYIRSTANPGGIGHGWVKQRFIDAMPAFTPHIQVVTAEKPDGTLFETTRSKIFIPASVFDNPALMKNDPNYAGSLAMLPEAQKRALLYGEWDSFEGQVFLEWKNNPEGYQTRRKTHVIEPFIIPKHWRRYRSFDFGYAKPFAVQWWAVDEDGKVYMYRQWYGCKQNSPNTGLKLEPSEIAKEIRRIETDAGEWGKVIGVADPSIWDKSRGYEGTIINMFEREGVYFSKGNNNRLAGKMQVHYRLAFDKNGIPGLYVFNTCREFIRTFPNLVYDEHKVEDIDTTMEDHDYDALRYFLMENPIKPVIEETRPEYQYNPFEQ